MKKTLLGTSQSKNKHTGGWAGKVGQIETTWDGKKSIQLAVMININRWKP